MTLLRKSLILALAALLVASCGGANPIARPTDDPMAGTFVLKGGGGALDAVKASDLGILGDRTRPSSGRASTTSALTPGVSLTVSGNVDLGYISRDLGRPRRAPSKPSPSARPARASASTRRTPSRR